MTVLESDFFVQASEPTVKTCYVDLSCFKTVIKGLCKTGLEHDFKEVQLLLQKMSDLEIKPDGTILSSILQS